MANGSSSAGRYEPAFFSGVDTGALVPGPSDWNQGLEHWYSGSAFGLKLEQPRHSDSQADDPPASTVLPILTTPCLCVLLAS